MGGTADAGITVSSAENPEFSQVLSFKLGVGQNIALRVSPAVEDSFFFIPR